MAAADPPLPIRCPQKVEGIALREIADGETMLLLPDMSEALVLNALGSAVWHLADGSRSLDAIAQVIHQRFADVALARIRSDVAELVAQLAAKGLLVEAAAVGAQKRDSP